MNASGYLNVVEVGIKRYSKRKWLRAWHFDLIDWLNDWSAILGVLEITDLLIMIISEEEW